MNNLHYIYLIILGEFLLVGENIPFEEPIGKES